MKKFLSLFILAFIFLSGFSQTGPNTYPTTGPAYVNGLQFYSPGWGIAKWEMSGNNIVHLVMPGSLGVALEVNGGIHSFDVQGYQLTSYQAGAIFGNTSGGNALVATEGKVWLNYVPGYRTVIGSTPDNGVDQLQVYGKARVNQLKVLGTTAPGYVLKDLLGDNNFTPQPDATGGSGNTSSGEYTPTIEWASNTNVSTTNTAMQVCTWTATTTGVGTRKVVTVGIYGTVQATNYGTTNLVITMPAAYTLNVNNPSAPVIINLGGTTNTLGRAYVFPFPGLPGNQRFVIQYNATVLSFTTFGVTFQYDCN